MIIQTKGLTKTYQSKVVVDHIDLAIHLVLKLSVLIMIINQIIGGDFLWKNYIIRCIKMAKNGFLRQLRWLP
ncbi:putative ABC transporter, ATP-binding protein [Lentilactobacillus farraginis DSM 18382 = JCM 14108]|uniref:Putative ABC transporter, ATP-binding protein n=1 Tax=Lentilactobacillus farraginis DSM 18382 = JCM 14108 TaxID=1423743 RepID=X0PL60_9LACO|nr:putative ABC transporter, ATP-binding protein [Lentilactobacillus farraginis DSM 18382 = JCM 14108]